MKYLFVIFSIILLIYMFWPGPGKIFDFPALPNSAKSNLEGDTIQIPNVSAYFSNNYRDFAVWFYSQHYQENTFFFLPPLRLNHPPEYSWIAIKRHTDSTYLEELIYPLRDSLYINGLELFNPDKTPKFWGVIPFEVDGKLWDTKVTLRFYPSSFWARFLVWTGISVSILFLYRLGRKILL
ncbi:MAG: hypothetical protein AAB414_02255 [Patescibacteria group bacterium]